MGFIRKAKLYRASDNSLLYESVDNPDDTFNFTLNVHEDLEVYWAFEFVNGMFTSARYKYKAHINCYKYPTYDLSKYSGTDTEVVIDCSLTIDSALNIDITSIIPNVYYKKSGDANWSKLDITTHTKDGNTFEYSYKIDLSSTSELYSFKSTWTDLKGNTSVDGGIKYFNTGIFFERGDVGETLLERGDASETKFYL